MRRIEISDLELDHTRAKIGHFVLQDCPSHPVYEFVTPKGSFLAVAPLMPVIAFCSRNLRNIINGAQIPANGAN